MQEQWMAISGLQETSYQSSQFYINHTVKLDVTVC